MPERSDLYTEFWDSSRWLLENALNAQHSNMRHSQEVGQRYWDDNLRNVDVELILRCEEWIDSEDFWGDISRERVRPAGGQPPRWESEFRKVESSEFDENSYKYFVGVEMEVNDSQVKRHIRERELTSDNKEACFPDTSKSTWDCVHDGSLNCGSEFRLREVYQGDRLFKEVRDFCMLLQGRAYKIDDTCSVHIHIDAIDMNLNSLKNLIKLHRRYEEFLYDSVSPLRINERFCRPTKSTRPSLTRNPARKYSFTPLGNAMTTTNLRDFKLAYYDCGSSRQAQAYTERELRKYYDGRYWGLNVHSIFLNGTVEVRHLHGTLDPNEINSWALINLAMVHKSITGLTRRERRTLEYNNKPTLREFMNLFPNDIQILFETGYDKERMYRQIGKNHKEDYVEI